MKTLQLPLQRPWFELTKAGTKTEDYRDISLYWFKRLVFNHQKVLEYHGLNTPFITNTEILAFVTNPKTSKRFAFKPFEVNKMTLGYPKASDNSKVLLYQHNGITIGTGNPDWGAIPGKLYFIIKHGKQLNHE